MRVERTPRKETEMGLFSRKSEPVAKAPNWALVRDGHAAAAVKAAARGDAAKVEYHKEQQKLAVERAREDGMWWIHA
jgi:hypothetical protein